MRKKIMVITYGLKLFTKKSEISCGINMRNGYGRGEMNGWR